ncbi:MAG: coproporphyrinogen III oxidase family protein, partial [Planctomycetes bacterium]|nr:coproporphyrinogen III oxidase family protein [Planctomycetota bacterium]
IPFCRKRCKFCYFRVYTDKAARDVETYLAALGREVEIYSRLPVTQGRPLDFVYFGGGTPSYLSVRQLESLVARLDAAMPWRAAQEVTFECEPGTLTQPKVQALRRLGITRLSLGIENFSDAILEENGRAHLSTEVFRSYEWIREAGFPQVNIDLIAGMVGETWDNWRDCIRKTIGLAPDSVTIYQMELPFNTVYSQTILRDGQPIPVANWVTKRAWVDYAFSELEAAGYCVSSAYTMVRNNEYGQFRYRDSLWHGAEMIGTGVASFSHVSGVHYQNVDQWDSFIDQLQAGELPLARALSPAPRQRLIRELILQLKLGYLLPDYFRDKFGTDILDEFRAAFEKLQHANLLVVEDERVELTRTGLLQVDRLLPEFFEPQYRGARYT